MKKWGSTTSCLESARALSVPGAASLMVTATTSTAATAAATSASSSISVTVSVSVPGAGSPLSGSRPVATAAGGGGHSGVTNLCEAQCECLTVKASRFTPSCDVRRAPSLAHGRLASDA